LFKEGPVIKTLRNNCLLGSWIKWYSTYLASTALSSNPNTAKKKKKSPPEETLKTKKLLPVAIEHMLVMARFKSLFVIRAVAVST
jgi:hypothetical protein